MSRSRLNPRIGEKPFIKSRPLDVHRWADYPQLNNCLDELVACIEAREPERKKRSKSETKKLRDCLRTIVLDLYTAWQSDPKRQVGIDLDRNKFGKDSRYGKLFLTHRPFKAAFEGLVALGYVQIDKKGWLNRETRKGKNTKARATPMLIKWLTDKGKLDLPSIRRRPDAPLIVLRDSAGNDLQYEATNGTRSMEANLWLINGVLQRNWFDLYLTDEEMTAVTRSLYPETTKPGATPRAPIPDSASS